LRADIDGHRQPDRSIAQLRPVAWVLVVCLAIAVAAPSLAAGNAPRYASPSLYKLSLKISNRRFLGNGAENSIAVDRALGAGRVSSSR
jgi:hypothetical protein